MGHSAWTLARDERSPTMIRPAYNLLKHLLLILSSATTLSLLQSPCSAEQTDPTTFECVFGRPGTFDTAMVEKVKSLPLGERLAIDRDHDGKNDELWYLENVPQRDLSPRTILVCVIDEDGDLDVTGPDRDSDLYLIDWQVDGIIDAVIDYQDEDNDGDVDQLGVYFGYFGENRQPWVDKNVVHVWWSRDISDANRLWYDVRWTEEQNFYQHRSHAGGDEIFYQFVLEETATQWQNAPEDTYAFYDTDNDGCSEVAVCLSIAGKEVSSLRYSMDVDNDAFGRNPHDYDFSITAIPENNGLQINNEVVESFQIRGFPVPPVLSWQEVREFARQAPWAKACLTWDEMNANTEEQIDRDPHERWEGVINRGTESFPQIGSPPSSAFNKRFEISLKPAQPLRLYYDSTDHRLHLLGANDGWIEVDVNLDGKVDARYVYLDTNGDGIFDRRQLDLDADGTLDFDWPMQVENTQKFELELAAITEFYQASLAQTLSESQTFIDAAKSVLFEEDKHQDPAATFFLEELARWMPETQLGQRMRNTPGGARFYLDLVRDRLFLALHKRFGDTDKWRKVEGAYQAGNYRAAATNLTGLGLAPSNQSTAAFKSYRRRISITLDNRQMPQRDNWPVTLLVSEVKKLAPDFNPDRCAVVAPQRWLEWRQLPHQVDQLQRSIGPEISFLADLPADMTSIYYLYYLPATDHVVDFPIKTRATVDRSSNSARWESNRGSYRIHSGQIDFFGKAAEVDSPQNDSERDIDALQVEKTSGLGGLTLYEADESWEIQNPAGQGNIKFTQRVLSQGPIRSAIEITAYNIPEQRRLNIRTVFLIYAEHQETEVRTTISDNQDGRFRPAPGIIKLVREQAFADPSAGVFGSWGWQEDAIGEIGLGLILAPQEVDDLVEEATERRIRCRVIQEGKLLYWLIGDWRRGQQYPLASTVDHWQHQLNELATRLLNKPQVDLGQPEILP